MAYTFDKSNANAPSKRETQYFEMFANRAFYHGPGPGKGGTGVLSVDGRELARQAIPHTIPLLMSVDETFDVGIDTHTPVDDSYKLPFRFTGKLDKLPFKLGPSQMATAEQKAAAEALARARD